MNDSAPASELVASKSVYRRIESLMRRQRANLSAERLAASLAPGILEEVGAAVGVVAIQTYLDREGNFTLLGSWGENVPDLGPGLARQLARLEEEESAREFPWYGRVDGVRLGVMPLDESKRVFFGLVFPGPTGPGVDSEAGRVSGFLFSLCYALQAEMRRRELASLLEEARAIQMSLLPPGALRFGDFEIAAASIPAMSVGGDLYDFFPLDDDTLVLTVADASGHGLPSALQARDVATGLRMGVERDLKIPHIVAKLNRVIHRSGLSSRFVSLVFGELETNGNFFYINAGHPAPLLIGDRGLQELTVGGLILGPNPEARYKLGFAHIDRGATLLLYTDGVVERADAAGEMFGEERLKSWLHEFRGGSAAEILEDLLARLREFGGDDPFEDDVTAVVVRRGL